ncbi:MAG: hypothetical protein KJ749_04810 [Planctomycetes bacterium]|nr:hypothetical protein [Planctomycetota bacterium]
MTECQRQIRRAQRRLWFNRWLGEFSWSVAAGALLFAVVVAVQRLFALPLPLLWIATGLGVGSAIASVIWLALTREEAVEAATRLDEAAGLRERISSSHFCEGSDDPFARAVQADAEQISSAVTVKQHIPLLVPRPLSWTVGSVVLAALMFLITPGLLAGIEASDAAADQELIEQTKAVIKQRMDAVRELAEKTPGLEDLKADLKLDRQAGGMLRRPGDIRHEAVKKIDKLADAVKKKQRSDDYERVQAMRKMMRRLTTPESPDATTAKLNRALQKGDFKSAQEEIQAMKEQLATLKSKEDKEMVARVSKDLDKLAKQLEQLAKDEKLAQQLEQAGIKKEDLERMLENLSKKDLDQLREQLAKKGMTQQQIDKLVKQMQAQRQCGKCAGQLAKGLAQAASAGAAGQAQDMATGLNQAADQLSALEQLEQEMNQLDATMAELQNARNDIGNCGSKCNGPGQGDNGSGMGNLGRGRGGLAPEQQTAVDFQVEKAKVQTTKGAIIGQFLVEGEQVKGEVKAGLGDVVTAAEHDASDRINRNRIPRQYQKAVKEYFSQMREYMEGRGQAAGSPSNAPSAESPSKTTNGGED